jgi:hypothetical protein
MSSISAEHVHVLFGLPDTWNYDGRRPLEHSDSVAACSVSIVQEVCETIIFCQAETTGG